MKKKGKKLSFLQLIAGILFLFVVLFLVFHFWVISNKNIQFSPGPGLYNITLNSTNSNDTYIGSAISTPQSNAPTMRIGKTGVGAEDRGLIEFDTSFIPQGYIIQSSTLQLYVNANSSQPNMTISAYLVTSPWNPSAANWTKSTSTTFWNSAGGDYNNSILIGSVNISQANQWYNFSVTDAVREWYNGSQNYGIILLSPNALNGSITQFASSENTSFTPMLFVDYELNPPPIINNISTDSNLVNPKNVGQQLIFSINWTDLEGDNVQIFVCNSSNINPGGCNDATFCNSASSSQSPSTCAYTVQPTDNRTTKFWVGACDNTINNCSINQSIFYMNHIPEVNLVQPNGGDVINQSQGNYTIKFNISDLDADTLNASLFYGTSQSSTDFPIATNIRLSNYCTDTDGTTLTTNNCSFSWNTTGIIGIYFLTVAVKDIYSNSSNSSNSSFTVLSFVDNTPPNITAQSVVPNATTSGSLMQFYANVSGQYLRNVWVTVNTTPQQNILMTRASIPTFNATFIAPAIGNYSFKVYADDLAGNINDSMPWDNFSIAEPQARTQNEIAPSIALPYNVIKISGELNSTDPLLNAFAYLNTPSGFTFSPDSPQNAFLGNFSANQTKPAVWFVSAPINESNYTTNITYYDNFSNSWSSQNMYTLVTSSVGGGYFLTVSGYPTVAAGSPYFAQATFTKNGIKTQADSASISIYDALGQPVVPPVPPVLMNNPSTGNYNYTYTIGSSINQGQWETIINATIAGVSYFANQFWNAVGGPFDVKNITINNNQAGKLNISVTVLNTGGVGQDLTLVWNITANGTSLETEGNTYMIPSNSPQIITIYPTTTYVGQVRITFIGTYSNGTQKAGAFKDFSIIPSSQPPTPPPTPTSSSGAGIIEPIVNQTLNQSQKDFNLNVSGFENGIVLGKNISKSVSIIVINTGKNALNNLSLTLGNLDSSYYIISPERIIMLKSEDKAIFTIQFLVTDFVGEKDFTYQVAANEAQISGNTKLIVMLPQDFFTSELERLQSEIDQLKGQTTNKNILNLINSCAKSIPFIQQDVSSQSFLDAETKIDQTDICLNNVRNQLNGGLVTRIVNYEFLIPFLILGIVVLLIIVWLVYRVNKRLDLLSFISRQETKEISQESKKPKSESFDEKIKKIEEELEG